ncbi:exodeoxyribonuclease III [Salisediminibacterium beveridgei]|uniref:Exodeoxyribonuclease III n=1 Tax=Salisediminibacterium beveridgei TaxID=632773 RepID=A0A1D7QT45_9BACI|nr:exodeoxyribonuclease III [Salisediminibacterium beveridgei]AOM82202.1 Exodeoxyribonuclease III [Salisediminibacterium beveridgei]
MKYVSWNVNGLRACIKKGFLDFFHGMEADLFAVQEIKLQEGQVDLDLEGYEQYWNYAEKKGYSGTAVFTKREPVSVSYNDVGNARQRTEGRLMTLEFADCFFVNVYTPNSQRDLARLDERLSWEEEFHAYLKALDRQKPVIVCGDMNVAHQEIDLKNSKTNKKNSGFTPEERGYMSQLLDGFLVDTYRFLYRDREGAYTWWSYMKTVRERNIGWRIDYFLVSERLKEHVSEAAIHSEVLGSDHCPVSVELDWRKKR